MGLPINQSTTILVLCGGVVMKPTPMCDCSKCANFKVKEYWSIVYGVITTRCLNRDKVSFEHPDKDTIDIYCKNYKEKKYE